VQGVTVDREGDFIWKQVADIIRARITDGTYPVGRIMPSAKTLSQELEVSMGTVNHALDLLRGQGLIESRIGRGMLVVKRA
jgi:GntR family transcriptional regulator